MNSPIPAFSSPQEQFCFELDPYYYEDNKKTLAKLIRKMDSYHEDNPQLGNPAQLCALFLSSLRADCFNQLPTQYKAHIIQMLDDKLALIKEKIEFCISITSPSLLLETTLVPFVLERDALALAKHVSISTLSPERQLQATQILQQRLFKLFPELNNSKFFPNMQFGLFLLIVKQESDSSYAFDLLIEDVIDFFKDKGPPHRLFNRYFLISLESFLLNRLQFNTAILPRDYLNHRIEQIKATQQESPSAHFPIRKVVSLLKILRQDICELDLQKTDYNRLTDFLAEVEKHYRDYPHDLALSMLILELRKCAQFKALCREIINEQKIQSAQDLNAFIYYFRRDSLNENDLQALVTIFGTARLKLQTACIQGPLISKFDTALELLSLAFAFIQSGQELKLNGFEELLISILQTVGHDYERLEECQKSFYKSSLEIFLSRDHDKGTQKAAYLIQAAPSHSRSLDSNFIVYLLDNTGHLRSFPITRVGQKWHQTSRYANDSDSGFSYPDELIRQTLMTDSNTILIPAYLPNKKLITIYLDELLDGDYRPEAFIAAEIELQNAYKETLAIETYGIHDLELSSLTF